MSFDPRFTVSNAITDRLARIERARGFLEAASRSEDGIRRMSERALLLEARRLSCRRAYYVEWHMRRRLAPIFFDDHRKTDDRESPVQPARKSDDAKLKANSGRTADGRPVYSFQALLEDLATRTRNRVRAPGGEATTANVLARPTPLQERALSLLDARL